MNMRSLLKAQTIQKTGLGLIKLFITLLFLFYLINELDIFETKQFILETNLSLFGLSFLFLLGRILFIAFRWKILLAFHSHLFSIITLTKYYFIGTFFGLFLPTVVGGDAARWYYIYEKGVKHNEALSSIIFERFLGLCCLILLTSTSLVLDFGIAGYYIKATVIILCISCLTFFLIIWNSHSLFKWRLFKNIFNKFRLLYKFIENLKSYSQNRYIMLYGLFISLVSQLMSIVSTYILSLSLGSSMPLLYFIIFLPIVWLISMIPISIAGLGLREGAFVFLFTSVGMEKEMAIAISALFIIQIIAMGMIGAFFSHCIKTCQLSIRIYKSFLFSYILR